MTLFFFAILIAFFIGKSVVAVHQEDIMLSIIEESEEYELNYENMIDEGVNNITYEEFCEKTDEIFERLYDDLIPSPTKYIYDNYNNNFAGMYYDNESSQIVTVISNPISIELREFLDNNSFTYLVVENSLNDLLEVYKIIGYDMISNPAFSGISIDIYSNKVRLRITSDTTDLSRFQDYIDDETLEVFIVEPISGFWLHQLRMGCNGINHVILNRESIRKFKITKTRVRYPTITI